MIITFSAKLKTYYVKQHNSLYRRELAYLEKFRISEYSRNVWNVTGKQIPHPIALLLSILLRSRPLTGLLTEYCPVSYQTCWSSISISQSDTFYRLRNFCWSKASVRISSVKPQDGVTRQMTIYHSKSSLYAKQYEGIHILTWYC
jgi:protein gp37